MGWKRTILSDSVLIVLVVLILVVGSYFFLTLPRVDPSVGLSLLALLVSTGSFYYSQFQGPVLMIVEDGELVSSGYPEYPGFQNYLYPNLPLTTQNLFIANDGNRVGDVTPSNLRFLPEEGFKPFYKELQWKPYLVSEKDSPIVPNVLRPDVLKKPVVIPPKDGRAVKVEFSLQILPQKNLDDSEFTLGVNIRNFIDEKLEEQRVQYTNMIELLERKGKLGELELEYRFTRRRWKPWFSREKPPYLMFLHTEISTATRRWEVTSDLYIDQISNMRTTLRNWDTIPKTVTMILYDLFQVYSPWVTRLTDLKNSFPLDPCPNVDALRMLRVPVTLEENIRILNSHHPLTRSLVIREPDLWAKIVQLEADMKEFGDRRSILIQGNVRVSDETLTKVNQLMTKCRREIDEILPRFEKLQEDLRQF